MASENTTAKRRPRERTSYTLRLWLALEEIEAQIELPEKLERRVKHVLWRDRPRDGEPTYG